MKEIFENTGLKQLAFVFILGGFFTFGGVFAFTDFQLQPDQKPSTSQEIGWHGEVTAKQYNSEGEVIYSHQGENILTNEGANFIRSHLVGETSNEINYIALTNASSYSTDKTHGYLPSEVTQYNLSRKKGTITKTDTGTWEIKAEWKANGSIDGVVGTGLFPHDVQNNVSSDSNILVAEESMNPKAFRDDYKFELTWEIEQVAG